MARSGNPAGSRGSPGSPGSSVSSRTAAEHVGAVRVRRSSHDASGPGVVEDDWVAVEEPLEIQLGSASVAVLMRTPGADAELARGFLVSEGIIGPDELESIRSEDERTASHSWRAEETSNVVRAIPRAGVRIDPERWRRHSAAATSCGVCGKRSLEQALAVAPPLADATRVRPDVLTHAALELARQQPIFAHTGGLHAAGLFGTDGAGLVVREDVGRHNAVDKVIGWAAAHGRLPLAGHLLAVSGRVSFEIVQKALAARIPVIAAVSAPSSLAVELATAGKVAIAAFLRGASFRAYGQVDRIASASEPAVSPP